MKVLFFDLETTGLDPEKTVILEVGAKVVDEKFRVLDQVKRVIHHDPIPQMDAWCLETHTKSGLLAQVKDRQVAVNLKDADWALATFVDGVWPENVSREVIPGDETSGEGQVILVGNGIHFDRRYIRKYMPKLNRRLHHRMIDVTSIHYGLSIFKPNIVLPEKKPLSHMLHRVFSDIDDSVNHLRRLMEEIR